MLDVCVVGSANLDLVAFTHALPRPGQTVLGSGFAEHPGGKGLNQAIASARAGARTAFVGAVGDDDAGRRLRAELQAAGVDVSATMSVDAPTGRALIAVDAAGENSIVVVPGANGLLTVSALPPSRVVLVQLEIPLAAVVAALDLARRSSSITILNPAPAPPGDLDIALAADYVVPNESEAASLGGVDALLAAGSGVVIITEGATGGRVATTDGEWRQAPFPVEPVDTTGAGDAFCGALAARFAHGDGLAASVRYATAAGALATTRHGAVPALPSAATIEALLSA